MKIQQLWFKTNMLPHQKCFAVAIYGYSYDSHYILLHIADAHVYFSSMTRYLKMGQFADLAILRTHQCFCMRSSCNWGLSRNSVSVHMSVLPGLQNMFWTSVVWSSVSVWRKLLRISSVKNKDYPASLWHIPNNNVTLSQMLSWWTKKFTSFHQYLR